MPELTTIEAEEIAKKIAAHEAQMRERISTDIESGRRIGGGQNVLSAVNECAGAKPQSNESGPVRVALSGAAAETLRCLFFHGPTWDGNVPSKSGRDELVNMGLAARGNGWQWLTRAGVEACFANDIQHEKDRRESRERKRRHQIEEAARVILG